MGAPNYSENLETLIAVVTHLAENDVATSQAKVIANEVSIDAHRVADVLGQFKGLFRKSSSKLTDPKEQSYSLHLRYAQKNEKNERPRLEPQYLIALLNFVSRKANEESQRSGAMLAALITASISLFASVLTLAITIFHTS